MGVSSTNLLAQRRATASMIHVRGHGDLDLTLALADAGGRANVDPAFAAHLAPIGTWAEAVWCSWLPLTSLRKLMEFTIAYFVDGIAWCRVKGPAAACLASATRL
eukprot:11037626-Karenia_brevis.AAC.1